MRKKVSPTHEVAARWAGSLFRIATIAISQSHRTHDVGARLLRKLWAGFELRWYLIDTVLSSTVFDRVFSLREPLVPNKSLAKAKQSKILICRRDASGCVKVASKMMTWTHMNISLLDQINRSSATISSLYVWNWVVLSILTKAPKGC